MPTLAMRAGVLLPLLAVAAGCVPTERYSPTVRVPPPPPPDVTGVLGAPGPYDAAVPPYSGSSVPPPAAVITPNAPLRLSAVEVAAFLANNTAIGTTASGRPYAIYFTADGRQRFREGSWGDTGTWHVLPDGELCTLLTQIGNGREQCYVLARSGDTAYYTRPDGSGAGSFRVLLGNPQAI